MIQSKTKKILILNLKYSYVCLFLLHRRSIIESYVSLLKGIVMQAIKDLDIATLQKIFDGLIHDFIDDIEEELVPLVKTSLKEVLVSSNLLNFYVSSFQDQNGNQPISQYSNSVGQKDYSKRLAFGKFLLSSEDPYLRSDEVDEDGG